MPSDFLFTAANAVHRTRFENDADCQRKTEQEIPLVILEPL